VPRVSGPLFSLGASGTLAKTLVYRTSSAMSTVAPRSAKARAASPAQQAHRARVKSGVVSWKAQSAPVREQWRDAAAGTVLTGYNVWLREWVLQGVEAPNVPLLPPS
jgi:hypothetical protein